MALINCPECGKQVSDRAVSCPNCGCPISSAQNNLPPVIQQALDRQRLRQGNMRPQNSGQQAASQPAPATTNVQVPGEEKVYFDGMVNETHCVIKSKNWYIGDTIIIPVTSVSAVSYQDYGKYTILGIIVIVLCLVMAIFMFTITPGLALIPIICCMGALPCFLAKSCIVVQANSLAGHRIICKSDQYSKCLRAMNQCLNENR